MTHGSRETVPLTKNNTALSVLKVTSLLVSLCVLVVVSARTEPGLETARLLGDSLCASRVGRLTTTNYFIINSQFLLPYKYSI